MKIAIVTVPFLRTINHFDYMRNSLESMISEKHELIHYGVVNSYIIEARNYLLEAYKFLVFNNENCLARAWNIGIRQAVNDKVDYILLPNLDVTFFANTIDNLVEFAENHYDASVFSAWAVNGKHQTVNEEGFYEVNHVTMWENYSCFMLRPSVIDRLSFLELNEPYPGLFDENIKPAYCEDQDFQFRLENQGERHFCTNTAQYFHMSNGTIKGSDNNAEATEEFNEKHSMPYLISKWGGIREKMGVLQ